MIDRFYTKIGPFGQIPWLECNIVFRGVVSVGVRLKRFLGRAVDIRIYSLVDSSIDCVEVLWPICLQLFRIEHRLFRFTNLAITRKLKQRPCHFMMLLRP
jgi:hypothetical protein